MKIPEFYEILKLASHVVQSVTCLTADLCLPADPGVAS